MVTIFLCPFFKVLSLKLDGSSEGSGYMEEIFDGFKKIFSDLEPSHIHNYYFCQERNCKDISSHGSAKFNKNNKFQHKWLFDPQYPHCEKTNKWCLVYIDGKGMFCSLYSSYDIKQHNVLLT